MSEPGQSLNPFPAAARADWEALVERTLKGGSAADLTSTTPDGITVAPLYGADDNAPAVPGLPEGGAEVRALVAEPGIGEANAAILTELEGGAASITLQVEAPGQPGVRIGSLEDFAHAFEGVTLDGLGVHVRGPIGTGEADAPLLWQLWENRGTPAADRCGGFGIDPIGWAASGAMEADAAAEVQTSAADLLALVSGSPSVTVFTATGLPYHEAGGTEAQELAAMLASAVSYLRTAETHGVAPGDAASRVGLELAADADLFATIAKLRAARLLWARVLEASGVTGARVRLDVQSSARMMMPADVHTNMLRTTAAALGAGIGGADAVTVLPFTHALGHPDGFGRRIARNTQIILRDESFVGAVRDPGAGSGAIEHLTQGLCETAWRLFQEIERAGGKMAALRQGLVQGWVAKACADRDAALKEDRLQLVGATHFRNADDAPPEAETWSAPPPVDAPFALLRPRSVAPED